MNEHLIIIGNGITGITCARNVRKSSNMKITVVSSETKYFFSRTALMYIYMGHMKFENTKPYEDWFWEKNNIDLLEDHVEAIDTDSKRLKLRSGKFLNYSTLVIATGSKSNKFGWKGQDLPGVQGLYSYQDLLLLEENSKNAKRAVIVGGGLIGIELAEMLHSRKIHVTILVREKYYWDNILPKEEAMLVSRHIYEHGFDLRLESELKEIVAGANGRVQSILTNRGEVIECQIVGLTPGVHPNIDVVKESKIKFNRGALVNDYLETNIPDVYAAGDCAEIINFDASGRNKIEQLWYAGRMQGEVLAKNILGERKKYERGVWFNSAKFLDIEYQTYGFVANVPRDGESSFYWEDASHKICFRLNFNSETHEVIGMNVFGIRMRHKVWNEWIKQKRTASFVIENLSEANFDPEFFSRYEVKILSEFRKEFPHVAKPNYSSKKVLAN